MKVIGRGSYGKVYLVTYTATGEIYAMKSIKKELILKTDQIAGTKAERNILERLDSPFIMKLQFAFQDKTHLYMIMDFVNGGELFYHLSNAGRFDETRARFYCAEVVLALEYLHSEGIVYRDLKPENILIDDEGHLKLTDFGLSKDDIDVEGRTASLCGTTEYLAPEIIKDKNYGYSVDWYSLGIVLYEMLTGSNPFKMGQHAEPNLVDQMNKILEHEFKMPKYLSDHAADVCLQLVVKDPTQRLCCRGEGAAEIKKHPWFVGIDWELLAKRQVTPPFIPETKGKKDISNIDSEFTSEAPMETPMETSALLKLHDSDAMFQNFTYVNNDIQEQARKAMAEKVIQEIDENEEH